MIPHRTCFDTKGRGCGRTLPETDFPKQGRNPDGSIRRRLLCRDCTNAVNRDWREDNPAAAADHRRRWVRRHPEKKAAYNAAYRAKHRDRLNEADRARRRSA